jgi:3-deoxy-7-phosphoheptulonate synthase
MVEVHPKPEDALSDGVQSLRPEQFASLVKQVQRVAESVDRCLAVSESRPAQEQLLARAVSG